MIGNEEITGLLDSGASVSCLGLNALKFLNKLNLAYKPIDRTIFTADGSKQEIKGIVDVLITYEEKTKPIELYVVPSLNQELYLGVDFWKAFSLAPAIISEVEAEPTQDPNIHNLSETQTKTLEIIKSLLASYNKEGLGKTSLMAHNINVGEAAPIKKRHYPVSPAIQKLMYDEIDRMIEMGVIEESQSA